MANNPDERLVEIIETMRPMIEGCVIIISALGNGLRLQTDTTTIWGKMCTRVMQDDEFDIKDMLQRTEDGRSLLHAAAFCDRINVVKVLLERGMDPTEKDSRRKTPSDRTRNIYIKELLKQYENTMKEPGFE